MLIKVFGMHCSIYRTEKMVQELELSFHTKHRYKQNANTNNIIATMSSPYYVFNFALKNYCTYIVQLNIQIYVKIVEFGVNTTFRLISHSI